MKQDLRRMGFASKVTGIVEIAGTGRVIKLLELEMSRVLVLP
jgi:hypothetical protein